MSTGEMLQGEWSFYPILLLAVLGACTDLLFGKIYNWMTFTAMGVGLLGSFYFSGFDLQVLLQSFLGILVGLLLYGWMFLIRTMGAGDVKYLMAFGALSGPRFTFELGILSILIGGMIAFFILLVRGRLRSLFHKIYYSVMTLLVKGLKIEFPDYDKKHKMAFGVAMALAAVLSATMDPWKLLGVRLWG